MFGDGQVILSEAKDPFEVWTILICFPRYDRSFDTPSAAEERGSGHSG